MVSIDQRVAEQYAAARHVSVFEPIKFSEACEIVGEFTDEQWATEVLAPIMEWLVSAFPAKIEGNEDVVRDAEENGAYGCAVAILWAVRTLARDGASTFSYVRDMAAASHKRGLTAGMIRGLWNCMRAEAASKAKANTAQIEGVKPFTDDDVSLEPSALFGPVDTLASTIIDLTPLISGARYAVPGDESSRLKIRVSRPKSGTWAGWTFVNDAAEYGYAARYGRQAPGAGSIYVGEVQDALRAILAAPREALERYCRITGTCAMCGRPLEQAESVAAGIGPVCRKKAGW